MENFMYSDEDCCNKCNSLYYDTLRGYYCKHTGLTVQPYNRACVNFSRILQGFGE